MIAAAEPVYPPLWPSGVIVLILCLGPWLALLLMLWLEDRRDHRDRR